MIPVTRSQAISMQEAHYAGMHDGENRREGCPECEGKELQSYPIRHPDGTFYVRSLDEVVALLGKPPNFCYLTKNHTPVIPRVIWHHQVPQACGGKTNLTNCIPICDNHHFRLHSGMWSKANSLALPYRFTELELKSIDFGVQGAIALGTLDKMPKEA
jgi:hypothetical protein